ncbi:hypothetical protein ACFLZ3_04115 [Candidatus Omnitrophota bacterium]
MFLSMVPSANSAADKKIITFTLFTSALVFLFFLLPRLSEPILGWGLSFFDMAKDIISGNLKAVDYYYDFPFYSFLIALGFKLFGIKEFSAYLIGILSVLMVPAVIHFTTKEISEKNIRLPVSLIAITLFITCPAAVQGALVIDKADTHVFLLVISLFYLFLFKTEGYPFWRRIAALAVLYCLCLFAKFSTSLVCLVSVPFVYWISKKIREGVNTLLCFFAAVVGFIAIWAAFCYYMAGTDRFLLPFLSYASSAQGFFPGFSLKIDFLKRLPLNIVYISFWFSPFLLILSFLAIFDLFKKIFSERDFKRELQLASFTLLVFLFYLYTNPLMAAFPKYVIPVLPFCCCLIAIFAINKLKGLLDLKSLIVLAILLFIGIIYYRLLVGDCLYSLFLLREAKLNGEAGRMFLSFGYQQVLFFLFPVLIFVISLKFMAMPLFSRFVCILLVSLFASNVSLCLIQRKADYSVNYSYGAKGAQEVKEFLQGYPGAEVFTSHEGFIANLEKVKFKGVDPEQYTTTADFLNFMHSSSPEIFIYGITSNTVRQIREVISAPVVTAYLDKHYKRFERGSYNILVKHGNL